MEHNLPGNNIIHETKLYRQCVWEYKSNVAQAHSSSYCFIQNWFLDRLMTQHLKEIRSKCWEARNDGLILDLS